MDEDTYLRTLAGRVDDRARDLHREAASEAPIDGRHVPGVDRLIARRYRLGERLGRGRLGEIYEALDEAHGSLGIERRAAIQIIDGNVSDSRYEELERGYEGLRIGSHPDIVGVLDFGRQNTLAYLVMERLEGVSLRVVLDEATALPIEEAMPVVRAVGNALRYLHAKGIVHGNVTPGNAFVTDDYAVKLLDIVPWSCRPSAALYWLEDAEAGRPQAPDVRDDVYGLACLAYELLSGRHPFNANSPLEAHGANLLPAPIDTLSVRQWQALRRGLELRRVDRAPDVTAFLSDFGVTGVERLRAPAESPAPPRAEPPRDEGPFADGPPRAFVRPRRPEPEETLETPRMRRRSPPAAEIARRKRSRRAMWLAVATGLLGAIALASYEQLRSRATDLIAAADARLGGRSPASTDREPVARLDADQPSGDTIRAAAPSEREPRGAPVAPASQAGQPEGGEQTSTEPQASGPEEITTASAPPGAAERPTEDATAASSASEFPGGPGEDTAASTAAGPRTPDHPPRGATAASPASESAGGAGEDEAASSAAGHGSPAPQLGFAQSVVVIAESKVAATVVVQRSGDLSKPVSFVWWLSEHTAEAGSDYADLGQRMETLAPGERSRALLIPLVDDALPESTESFYVYVGRYAPRSGHLDPLDSVRVDIVDDD
jgi:hypothetical protein